MDWRAVLAPEFGVAVLAHALLASALLGPRAAPPATDGGSAVLVAQFIADPAQSTAPAAPAPAAAPRPAVTPALPSVPQEPVAASMPPVAARSRPVATAALIQTSTPRAQSVATAPTHRPRSERHPKARPAKPTPTAPARAAPTDPGGMPAPVSVSTAQASVPVATPPAVTDAASVPTRDANAAHGKPTASADEQRAYLAAILARLNRYKTYPTALKKEKIEGLVVMRFTIAADGRVVAAAVQRSSGSAALDHAAQDMLERASPLPAIPPTMGRSQLTLAVPVDYSLLTER